MPEEQENFQNHVQELMNVIIFENWLRFYFIQEKQQEDGKDGKGEAELAIEVPEKSMEKIRELYPEMLPLAEALNGHPIDFETSRKAIMLHVLEEVDGKLMPKDTAQNIFSSSTFQTRLQLFHAWTQMHEEQLDQHFLDYGTWLKFFNNWVKGTAAKKIMESWQDQA